LKALYSATKKYADASIERTTPFNSLRAEAYKGEVVIVGKQNVPAKLTNWGFKQFCGKAGAPVEYLVTLPATLAVQNLNHGLKKRSENKNNEQDANLLFHKNGGMICRSIMTEAYERIWNYELCERLLELEADGWEPARPDFRKMFDDFPALYASDHDMFAMIRLKNEYIEQPINPSRNTQPMYKGLIYWNGEVGNRTIGAMKFLYNGMCGNHIIWGASEVVEFSAKHVGSVRDRLHTFDAELKSYSDESLSDLNAKIKAASKKVIAGTKEEVLDFLFGKRSIKLSRKVLDASYDAVIPEQDGSPNTVWGMMQGLTRHSQTIPYADERLKLDRAGSELLKLVF